MEINFLGVRPGHQYFESLPRWFSCAASVEDKATGESAFTGDECEDRNEVKEFRR